MRMRRWTASVRAREHMLEKHNVEWREVEEVMATHPQVLKGKKRRGERRYQTTARTASGRRLKVVFRIEGDTAWVITAYEED